MTGNDDDSDFLDALHYALGGPSTADFNTLDRLGSNANISIDDEDEMVEKCNKCECGAESVESNAHSHWCPKHNL